MDVPMSDDRSTEDVRLPAASLASLAETARRAGEPVATAVRKAGRAAGESLAHELARSLSFSELDANDFWAAVNSVTESRGLGTFEYRRGVGGHAQLLARDTVESRLGPAEQEGPPDHPFSEGLLEGLLAAAAEQVVGVVCAPADGGDAVRFVIGAPVLLRHIRLRLEHGLPLDAALEGL
jgi:hypothetical protein